MLPHPGHDLILLFATSGHDHVRRPFPAAIMPPSRNP
jgi:hypothetical protein